MSRFGAAALAPAYHASTMVWSRPKARIATINPSTVKPVRSLWRRALRRMSFRNCTASKARSVCRALSCRRTALTPHLAHGLLVDVFRARELALVEVHDGVRAIGGAAIVRHHHDGLAELDVQAIHQREHLLRRLAVEVAS